MAKQDAWVSALITPIISIAFIWLYDCLARMYPGKNLIEIFSCTFGKWIGWVVSAVFVLFVCFLDAAQVIFYIGNFVQSNYMLGTPLYALNLLLTLALIIGILYGIETIARSAEIFIVIVIILVILMLSLNIQNIKMENILPALENGIAPTLKGSLYLISYITWPLIVFNMINPASINEPPKARRSMLIGFTIAAVMNLGTTIMSILVLGSPIVATSPYPSYLLAQQGDIGILTRIESILAMIWMMSQFIRISIYFYAGIIGLSQMFGLKDHKRIVWPLGLILFVYSMIVYPDPAYQQKWDTLTWVPFIGTFGVVLPILMLLIAFIKRIIKNVKISDRAIDDNGLNENHMIGS